MSENIEWWEKIWKNAYKKENRKNIVIKYS